MKKMTALFAAGLACSLALQTGALAATTTGELVEDNWPAGEHVFGARAKSGANDSWSVGVGQLPGDVGQFDQATTNWTNSFEPPAYGTNTWGLYYDGERSLSFHVNDTSTEWTLDSAYEIDNLWIRTFAEFNTDSKVTVSDIRFGEMPIDGQDFVYSASDVFDETSPTSRLLKITPGDGPLGAFYLNGLLDFGWEEDQPTRESLKMDVLATGNAIPVPTPAAAGAGLAMLLGLGATRLLRRRSHRH